jgi:hypothetical protein
MTQRHGPPTADVPQEKADLTNRHTLATETGEYVSDMLFKKDKALADELFTQGAEKTGRYTVKHMTGSTLGPMPAQMLMRLIEDGGINTSLYACAEGTDQWIRIDQIPEFQSAVVNKKEASEASIVAPVLEGDLDSFGVLPYLFQVQGLKRSGWLRVEIDNAFCVLAFKTGVPISVYSTLSSESDEAMLVTDLRISEDQLEQARELSKRDKIAVMDALVDLGFIASSAVAGIFLENAKARLSNMLSASSGRVRFDLDDAAGSEKPVLDENLMDITVELLSEMDNARLLQAFGTEQESLDVLSPYLPEEVPDFARAIVQALGVPKDLRTLIGEVGTRGPEGENTLATVFLLAGIGVVGSGSEEKRAIRDVIHWLNEVGEFGAISLPPTATETELKDAFENNVRAKVREAARMVPSGDLTLQALNRRLDEFERILSDPVERYVQSQAHSMGLDSNEFSVRSALEAECLERLIESKIGTDSIEEIGEWAAKHRQLVLNHEAIAGYQLLVEIGNENESSEERERNLERLTKTSEAFPGSLPMQLAMVEGAIILNHHGHARRALATADKISGGDPRIKLLKDRIKQKKAPTKKRGRRSQEEHSGAPQSFLTVNYIGIGVIGIFWVLSCGIGLGQTEDNWNGTNGFWYMRRLLLIIAAFAGFYIVNKKMITEFFSAAGMGLAPIGVICGLALGIGSGYVTPLREYETAVETLVGLAIFHAVAEQLFFTGFLTKELRNSAPSQLTGVGLSAAFYGLYQLSFYTFFYGIRPSWIPFWMLMMVLGAGLPYALLYHLSRSLIPPMVCQLAIVLTYISICT